MSGAHKSGRGKAWVLDDARKKRVRSMQLNGYTLEEMARSLCVSASTLKRELIKAGMLASAETEEVLL